MNRRKFIKLTSLVAGTIVAAPKVVLANTTKRYPGYTIDQILAVSFPAAKAELLKGRNWHTHNLNEAQAEGRIVIRPIGCLVEDNGKYYGIQQASVPMVWTESDNFAPESKKISIVANMIESAFISMDWVLWHAMADAKLVVSKEYRYDRGETLKMTNGCYFSKLYTAFAQVD